MCVCVCVCVRVRVRACVHVCVHARLSVCLSVNLCLCLCVHAGVSSSPLYFVAAILLCFRTTEFGDPDEEKHFQYIASYTSQFKRFNYRYTTIN